MLTNLTNAGFVLEKGHHEVGSGGQAEINYEFNTLLHAADDHQMYKYIVKQTAWQAGKTVTFMPKPLFKDNGSGMHCHESVEGRHPTCSTRKGTRASQTRPGTTLAVSLTRAVVTGLLRAHNQLLRGWSPVMRPRSTWCIGQRNRSACVRIPMTSDNPKAKRIEFRSPTRPPTPIWRSAPS